MAFFILLINICLAKEYPDLSRYQEDLLNDLKEIQKQEKKILTFSFEEELYKAEKKDVFEFKQKKDLEKRRKRSRKFSETDPEKREKPHNQKKDR